MPDAAMEAEKAALVAEALRHLKASGAAQARARWFFQVLVEAAGVDALRAALMVFDADFVTSSKRATRKPGPRFRAHSVARQLAQRWDAYQKSHGGKSFASLQKKFVKTLPHRLKLEPKRTANLLALGRRLNRQRRLLARIAAARKSTHTLLDIDGRRTARIGIELRELAKHALSDEELQSKLSEAEYLNAASSAAILGDISLFRLVPK
jgi:hypothetical protein